MTQDPTPNPAGQQTPVPPTLYARKATGLVRDLGPGDMIVFNAASTTAISVVMAVTLFYVMVAFPRANIALAIVLNLALCGLMWVAFALLGAAMPKAGGDYVFNGRILHPALGLAGNWGAYLAAWVAGGFFAVEFVRAGVGPALTVIGLVAHTHWFVTAGSTVLQNGWSCGLAIAVLVVCTGVSMLGTKVVVRANTICYLVSAAGVVISTIIILFVGHGSFVSHVNSFSRPYTHLANTYSATIAAGAKAGLTYPSGPLGYSTSATIGAMFPLLGGMLWVWWGVYLSPEMKSGGRRKRQLTTILGAGFGQGLLLLVALLVFIHVAGYDFMAAATGGNFGVPVAPYYDFFASIAVASPAAGVILSIVLIFGFFTAVYINIAMMQRAPFAWSLDGIAPQIFAKVDERTHTPTIAIIFTMVVEIPVVVWAAYSTSFTTFIGLFTLFGLVTIFVTGVAALLMPRLRPELYKGSPADWRLWGVPVLPVAGVGAIVMAVFSAIDAVHFHTQNGVPNEALMIALPFAVIAGACLYYFAARAMRRSQGINIDLVYKTIPPD